jgi:hypothetical protein
MNVLIHLYVIPRSISSYFQGVQLFKIAFFLFISPQISACLRYEHLPLSMGQEELVSCSSDYSTRWLAIK